MIRTLAFSAITLAVLGFACAPEATTNNDALADFDQGIEL